MRKTIAWTVFLVLIILSTGCHSGTVNGMGADVEKLGQKIQD